MEIKAVKFRKDGFYSQPFASLGYKPEIVYQTVKSAIKSHIVRFHYRKRCEEYTYYYV